MRGQQRRRRPDSGKYPDKRENHLPNGPKGSGTPPPPQEGEREGGRVKDEAFTGAECQQPRDQSTPF